MSQTDKYTQRGVSADKEDVHRAIKNIDKGLFPKAFCKLLPDYLHNNPNYTIAMHADGAGTKSSLAYAYWKETGDLSVWKGIAQDALVMNTDDLLCVGAVDKFVLSSTIGRNKNLISGDVIKTIIEANEELAEQFQKWGIELIIAGGETADVGDLVKTIIVDSTVIARLPKSDVIDNARIKPGDCIVGLSSFGQANYETSYNSGIGSNGLTSARHDIFNKKVASLYPETYDKSIDDVAYTGKHFLTDIEPETGVDFGKLVLSPTRTYAPIIKSIFKEFRNDIHGMIHCSGGGQTKVLHFIDNLRIVKDNLFSPPPLFQIIQNESGNSLKEMYKVFNMGHRMELYVPENRVNDVIQISESFGVSAQQIGYCEASNQKEVIIKTKNTIISYP